MPDNGAGSWVIQVSVFMVPTTGETGMCPYCVDVYVSVQSAANFKLD